MRRIQLKKYTPLDGINGLSVTLSYLIYYATHKSINNVRASPIDHQVE